jgi:hypothetical protein
MSATIKNINDLRNLSLSLIDDLIQEKMDSKDDKSLLSQVNKQITNAVKISDLEIKYAKHVGKRNIDFFEYKILF